MTGNLATADSNAIAPIPAQAKYNTDWEGNSSGENYDQYLQYIANLDVPIKEKYELLCIVNTILCHFVDTAFGVQTDQITLRSIGRRFTETPDDATREAITENRPDKPQGSDARYDSNSAGPNER